MVDTGADQDSFYWDTSLIARYDLSGPRYTSYPTAPQFREDFLGADLSDALKRSNRSARPLSLYFHIPFCSTVCYYCACNKVITANRARAKPYLESMVKEMTLMSAMVDRSRTVKQLHWGGGTPTYISDDEKRFLMGATRQQFHLLDDDSGEYSIEVHPGDMQAESIFCLREIGFNRLSMGIQDFDPKVQTAINRFNSYGQVKALLDAAREAEFHSISMDLIYGLPHQSWQTFEATLEKVLELNPDRLSIFNYAHMPHLFKVQKQIEDSALPSAEDKLKMLEKMTRKLLQEGYVYIGMDHFALPDDDLAVAQKEGHLQRNFQGYSTHGGTGMLAFGCSSISSVDNVFFQNHKSVNDYMTSLENDHLPLARGFTLNKDDQLRQYIIEQLICHFRLDFRTVEETFNISFEHYFANELESLAVMHDDCLLELTAQGIKVTAAGRLLVRRICMVFDIYLNGSSEIRYSRII